MNFLLDLLLMLATTVSMIMLLGLLYLAIFEGPSPLDCIPDPTDNDTSAKEN
jgi:hypothetical protein